MKNNMMGVAAMLGLAPGEEFCVEGCGAARFRFTTDNLEKLDGHGYWNACRGEELRRLITGERSFERLAWRPDEGQIYYYVTPQGNVKGAMFCHKASVDILHYAFGNCFKTEEEAEKNKDKFLGIYRKIVTGEWVLRPRETKFAAEMRNEKKLQDER